MSTETPRKRVKYRPYTEEERAAIRQDKADGLTASEIARKHGIHPSTVQWILGYRPPAKRLKPARPVKMKGETNNQYGIRVQAWMIEHDPNYIARWKQRLEDGVAKARAKHMRRAKAACISLNKTETRGIWHTTGSLSAAKGNLSPFLTSKFATTNALEVRKFARFRIYLIPHAALEQKAIVTQTPEEVGAQLASEPLPPASQTPPPPSFWQRYFGWLWS